MSRRQWTVVAYDVSSNARRLAIHRELKGFLWPIQNSLFEGMLTEKQRARLTESIRKIIDSNTDRVRVYTIQSVMELGAGPPMDDPDEPFFW